MAGNRQARHRHTQRQVTAMPEPCNARYDDVTSIRCHRDKGHGGEHEGTTYVTWERDEEDGDA